MFDYLTLINLDIRDLKFWYKEAQILKIRRQIRDTQCVRAAQLKSEDYKMTVNQLNEQIGNIIDGKEQTVGRNLDDLKLIHRQKKIRN